MKLSGFGGRDNGMEAFAKRYSLGPSRVQFQNKDPRGWKEFADQLAMHSAAGAAFTQLGVQKQRPSLFDLEEQLNQLQIPTLIVTGDEDWPCLAPNVYLKRVIPSASLLVIRPCFKACGICRNTIATMDRVTISGTPDTGAPNRLRPNTSSPTSIINATIRQEPRMFRPCVIASIALSRTGSC